MYQLLPQREFAEYFGESGYTTERPVAALLPALLFDIQDTLQITMLNKLKMHGLIKSGRCAIEYSLLGVIIRPRALTADDETELAEITTLLHSYNKWMAQYELPDIINLNAANDQINTDDQAT